MLTLPVFFTDCAILLTRFVASEQGQLQKTWRYPWEDVTYACLHSCGVELHITAGGRRIVEYVLCEAPVASVILKGVMLLIKSVTI